MALAMAMSGCRTGTAQDTGKETTIQADTAEKTTVEQETTAPAAENSEETAAGTTAAVPERKARRISGRVLRT